MKLRLIQGGFETYTGQMGVVWFENGLSTTEVLPIDAVRIAATIGAEWEDGTAANVGAMYLNNMHTPAFVGMGEPSIEEPAATEASSVEALGTPGGTLYTAEELAKIADEKGINGLREIAEPLGVKATSIVTLMELILKAQDKQQAQAE